MRGYRSSGTRPRGLLHRCLVGLLAVFLVMGGLAVVQPPLARGEVVKADAEQVELNDAGIDAMIAGEFDKAIALFEKSLALGELNVTYLNLGRAQAKQGKCVAANQAFLKVRTTPVVDDPPEADVLEVLTRYERELRGECLGTMTLRCDQEGVEVSIDGEPRRPCSSEPFEHMPGPVNVVAYLGGETSTQSVEITPRGDAQVLVHVEVESAEPAPVSASSGGLFTGTRLWFWGAAGLGAAMVATGLVFEVAVLGPEIDDYRRAAALGLEADYADHRDAIQSWQAVNTSLYLGGAALIAAGVALALFLPDENEAGASSAAVWTSDDGAGFVWTTRW